MNPLRVRLLKTCSFKTGGSRKKIDFDLNLKSHILLVLTFFNLDVHTVSFIKKQSIATQLVEIYVESKIKPEYKKMDF